MPMMDHQCGCRTSRLSGAIEPCADHAPVVDAIRCRCAEIRAVYESIGWTASVGCPACLPARGRMTDADI